MSDEFKPLTVGDLVDCLSEFPRDVPLWTWDHYWDEPLPYMGLPDFTDEDGVRGGVDLTVGELIEALSKFDPDAMVVAHRGSMDDRDFPEPQVYELSDWEKRKNFVRSVWTGEQFVDIPEGAVFL